MTYDPRAFLSSAGYILADPERGHAAKLAQPFQDGLASMPCMELCGRPRGAADRIRCPECEAAKEAQA